MTKAAETPRKGAADLNHSVTAYRAPRNYGLFGAKARSGLHAVVSESLANKHRFMRPSGPRLTPHPVTFPPASIDVRK